MIEHDIDLQSTGNGWTGTFALLINFVVRDLTASGFSVSAAVNTFDDDVYIGRLRYKELGVITIGSIDLEVEAVKRLRA